MNNELKYWIWLNSIEDVGPVRAKKLLQTFKTIKKIWNARHKELLLVDGIGEQIIEKIQASKNEDFLNSEINNIINNEVKTITLEDKEYPQLLRNIYSSPILLYYKGTLYPNEKCIAIVGSRKPSQYGMRAAYELARQLAKRGITIVSGMARGIDTQAHKGALDAGGRTIAVLGCGVDVVYPPENKELMKKIIENGAVISEYLIGISPEAKNFPARNRIISGISLGTIVCEANSKSGSLITADFALDQNREVFAVPGSIYSKMSEGTNSLIKQGAKIVCCAEDVIEELNINSLVKSVEADYDKVEDIQVKNLSSDEAVVYNNIQDEPVHVEAMMKNININVNRLNTVITLLELKGLIKQLPGKQFVRN